jgi:hypothetical protein
MASDFNRTVFLTLSLLTAGAGLRLDPAAVAQEKESAGSADVVGNVTLRVAGGATIPAAGVRLTLTCEPGRTSRVEISDTGGAFRFENVPADGCDVVTDLQGFRSERAAVKAAEAGALQIGLEVEPIFAGLTVTGRHAADARLGGHSRRSSGRGARTAHAK